MEQIIIFFSLFTNGVMFLDSRRPSDPQQDLLDYNWMMCAKLWQSEI